MGSLAELLGTGERQTLEFFFLRLKEVSEPTVDHQELLYNASVLAHYARVSTHSAVDLATPATLGEVFEHFVFDTSLRNDGAMMEAAGAQCLLLAGFFQDQMCRRHDIHWYAEPRRGILQPSGRSGTVAAESAVCWRAIAAGFEPWRQRHARLRRELRDQPYLLKVDH